MYLAKCLEQPMACNRNDLNKRPIDGIAGDASESAITQNYRIWITNDGSKVKVILWERESLTANFFILMIWPTLVFTSCSISTLMISKPAWQRCGIPY
jgi:hypothetical protein